jgi:hypothetical protein
MRTATLLVATVFAIVAAPLAEAGAKSCSSFAIITAYDAGSKSVQLKVEKGREAKFFPKPEGTPKTSKIPGKCSSRVLKQESFPVTLTGGKLTVTQVRMNFSAKMLNDTGDETWLPKQLEELIAGKTKVLVVARPPIGDKKGAYGLTTIYLPASQEDLDEIKRIDDQAEDE